VSDGTFHTDKQQTVENIRKEQMMKGETTVRKMTARVSRNFESGSAAVLLELAPGADTDTSGFVLLSFPRAGLAEGKSGRKNN
jgi:hypothetical protein